MRLLASVLAVLLASSIAAPLLAQPTFSGAEIFPASEFAARRAKVLTQIGDGAAILLGTTEPAGEMPFRQNSQFFYLSGLTEPRAALILDGRTGKATVYMQPFTDRQLSSMYGPRQNPGPETAVALGVDGALPRAEFSAAVNALLAEKRTLYTPFAAEVLGSQSQGDPTRLWKNNAADPWDGRDSREATFIAKLKAQSPEVEVKNLDPILNAMRAVKSPAEIAVIREATHIAGLGIEEAMRDSKPGLKEYELQADAEFVFTRHGALGASYFALIATGKNTYYPHYNRNTATLADGDLVQFDYAPDFKYYQSDVTRVFPANGRFTPRQREMYEIYLRLYQAVMTSVKAHVTVASVLQAAVVKMDAIMAAYKFTDLNIKKAAVAFVENYRRQSAAGKSLGHYVGLEVHDVSENMGTILEPGRIFTIEPQFRIEEDHIGIRLEDMLLITENGYENLSAFVPIEVKDIEKMMAEKGLSDAMLK